MIYSQNFSYIHQFTHKNFVQLIKKYDYKFNEGDIVAGIVFSIEYEGALVDIGASNVGYLSLNTLVSSGFDNFDQIIGIYETREFIIMDIKKKYPQLTLSVRYLEYIRAWERLKQIYLENLILRLHVSSYNKGGLIVNIEGLKAFVPNSHLIYHTNKKNWVNKLIPLKLLEVDEEKNLVVLSYICAILQTYKKKLFIGQIVTGVILNIESYGLFVDIGNIKGLLHISEIANYYIDNLHDIFTVGKSLQVMIVHLDLARGRISFSLKQIMSQQLINSY
uniref:30S ribosomal protein S1 n=1 Tax=Bulboplastis apyrenoidosa TaxID=1070855 RepID=A0A1Y9TM48_9RHOD|nr:30S ribosomal protein S1 [Bulboplastis apyrenoidosa]ARO90735.1 30S ribosomal protein S1 [Bulboplastis apyrenoidosa]